MIVARLVDGESRASRRVDVGGDDRVGAAVLKELRRARRRPLRQTAYLVYVAVLVVGVWGSPALVDAWRSATHPFPAGATTLRVLAALPLVLAGIGLVLLDLGVRQAGWRGPVALPAPAVDWLLPLPIARARLLRPQLRRNLVATAVAAGVLGVVGALVLHALGAPRVGATVAAATAGTVGIALLAQSLAGLAEDDPVARWARRLALAAGILGRLVVLAGLVAAVRAWPAWTTQLAAWSGPWGWLTQPVLTATGAGHFPGWPAALAAGLLVTAVLVVAAWRRAPRIPTRALRRRARVGAQVRAGVFSLELRSAALAARSGFAERRRVSRLRIPLPRAAWAVVAWRDLLLLVRDPRRASRVVVLAGLGVGLLVAAAGGPGAWGRGDWRGYAMVTGAALALFLAADQLGEAARLDSDDMRRTRLLPFAPADLATRHLELPAVILLVLTGVGGALANPRLGTLLVGGTLVAVTAAGWGWYRGPVPVALISMTPSSPVGNPAPVLIAIWFAASPLIAVTVMTLTWASPVRAAGLGQPVAGSTPWVIQVAAAGMLLALLRARAGRRS
ncbi:MAG: DUF6297 family protein [Actinomycetes bacterium]